jgi:fructokinase
MTEKLYGGIEAGGTKFLCIVAAGPQDIRKRVRFETTAPAETLGRAIRFFEAESSLHKLEAIGIGSFGPLDLDPGSATFGYITSTPKPGWSGTDLAGFVRKTLKLPVLIDTDVNAAALAEGRWGAARGVSDFVYLTVGTGIGGGAVVAGRLVHGLVHPEMGHVVVRHDFVRDPFPGCCPFHGDCLEGMASGTAMQKRWGQAAEELPPGHLAWELESEYLAQGLVNLICVLSPRRIILGGGVSKAPQLLPGLRSRVQELLNNYVNAPQIIRQIDQYILAPGLGDLSGALGAIALAQDVSLPQA